MTLTEVVVAAGLLLLGIMPILKALSSSQTTHRIVDLKTRSLTLAQSKLDEVTARSIYDFEADYSQTSMSLSSGFFYSVTDDGHASLKTITVSVGHDTNQDTTYPSDEVLITLKTLLAKRI